MYNDGDSRCWCDQLNKTAWEINIQGWTFEIQDTTETAIKCERSVKLS